MSSLMVNSPIEVSTFHVPDTSATTGASASVGGAEVVEGVAVVAVASWTVVVV
ncbi:MAG: hypothetical protein KJN71_10050 [Acidimicrobiia bacterium]|nr:hypothetical protein [Acidimicrobiia bacterium]